MVAKVCSMSHGQPRSGSRSRRITASSRSMPALAAHSRLPCCVPPGLAERPRSVRRTGRLPSAKTMSSSASGPSAARRGITRSVGAAAHDRVAALQDPRVAQCLELGGLGSEEAAARGRSRCRSRAEGQRSSRSRRGRASATRLAISSGTRRAARSRNSATLRTRRSRPARRAAGSEPRDVPSAAARSRQDPAAADARPDRRGVVPRARQLLRPGQAACQTGEPLLELGQPAPERP